MPVNFAAIKRRREQLTLTMEEAARKAGHTGERARIWWNDIESGKNEDPRVSTLELVAYALSCGIDDLLWERPLGKPPEPPGTGPSGSGKRQRPKPQKRKPPSGSAGSKG